MATVMRNAGLPPLQRGDLRNHFQPHGNGGTRDARELLARRPRAASLPFNGARAENMANPSTSRTRSFSSSRPGSKGGAPSGAAEAEQSPPYSSSSTTAGAANGAVSPLQSQTQQIVPRGQAARKDPWTSISSEKCANMYVNGLEAVLFLDVDGVLHPQPVNHVKQQFQPANMRLLAEILQATGATIILSTTWRLHPDARRALAEKLVEHGLPLFQGRTPSLAQFQRAKEILTWVHKCKPGAWVAVDDWPLQQEGYPEFQNDAHFVQTHGRRGITRDIADRIIASFKRQKQAHNVPGEAPQPGPGGKSNIGGA